MKYNLETYEITRTNLQNPPNYVTKYALVLSEFVAVFVFDSENAVALH